MTNRTPRRPCDPPEAADPPAVVQAPGVAMAAAVDRLALRLDEVAASLGVSRRAIERMRSAGKFPKPDMHIGKVPVWTPRTIREWLERGGHP